MPEVAVASDPTALAERAAEFIVRLISQRERDSFHIALSGGHTPEQLYRTLAQRPFVEEIPWPLVHLWWGDERAVGPESHRSNYRLVREALLRDVPIPADNVHRIEAELGGEAAASRYEQELIGAIGAVVRFDLVLLGVGVDGHTASLFPGFERSANTYGHVIVTEGGDPPLERVTLTLETINAAAEIVMLAQGHEKAQTVQRILMRDLALPAARIELIGGDRHFHIFLDRAAASALEGEGS